MLRFRLVKDHFAKTLGDTGTVREDVVVVTGFARTELVSQGDFDPIPVTRIDDAGRVGYDNAVVVGQTATRYDFVDWQQKIPR